MRKTVKKYLYFTRAEQRTAFGVFVCILALFVVPECLPRRTAVPDTQLQQLLALLPEHTAHTDSASSDHRTSVIDTSAAFSPIAQNKKDAAYITPFTPAPFMPDTLTTEEWVRMGVPGFVAARMEKYRSKGGKFRDAADVQKIYGFPPDVFELLMPYMVFEKAAPAAVSAVSAAFDYTGPVVDMNTATAEDWARLGFDANEIIRIEKFRAQCGGFYSPEQLYTVFGIQATHIQRAEPWMQADKNSVIKINLNTADSVTLAAHVYISDELAGAIIRYRNTTGKYYSVQEVAKVPGMYPALLEKLKPYLRL